MTTIVGSGGRRLPKEKKSQSNKSNSVINNSIASDGDHNHNNDKLKLDPKLQPTPEQIRIANLMNDKMDDIDLKDKIEQIIELTGSTRDEAVVALHDCDNDTAKAIDMILEGYSLVESEWRSTGKKKKPPKTSGPTSDENTKPDNNPNKESKIENRDSFKQSINKSDKSNRVGGRGGGPPRLQRAALANRGARKPKEFNNNFKNERNDSENQNNDIFSGSAQQAFRSALDPLSAPSRRGDRRGRGRGGPGRGGNRGAFIGGSSAGRGSRTFQNRGLQSNDGFPNSIDTWSNSTADQTQAKSATATDCNTTMTVGNWSDIAANEDWSEEDWEPNHMETKVFTPSTKISEKDEMIDVRENISSLTSSQPPNLSQYIGKPSVDSSQPTMSSILSGNISRPANVTGQALLQHIQQSSASQPQPLNQYTMSQNTKQATEIIKSLVGLTSSSTYNSNNADLLSSNVRDLDHQLSNSQTSNLSNKTSRMKVTRSSSKIPESAVEMPSNDSIAALGVHFGTFDLGSDNSQFSLGTDNSSVFQDVVSHVTKAKKPESKNLSTSSMLSQSTDASYRPQINDGTNKVVSSSIIQNSVLGHQSLTSDSLLDRSSKSSVNPYGQKVLDRTNKSTDYSSVSPQQTVCDITSTYKPTTYSSDPTYNYATATTASYPYSSSSQTGGYGNQVGNYSSNFSGSTINNHSNSSAQKLRDIDTNSQQKQYDVSNAIVTNSVGSLGLISNSTVTTNVLKNTLSATGKGVHNVPPGVAATPVLSTPYIVGNAGLPIYPMGIPYDVQFQTTGRDHNFATYATQDVKYGRGSDADVIPVSTSQTGGASQTHNQTFVNTFPPGYGFFYATPGVNMMAAQGIYPAAQPIYPVAQPQNNVTGSGGSAFAKANTNYGSHSYNSGYDSLSGVAQTQDYVKQSYPQSVQQHSKGISGSNTSDLTTNPSIYGKTHSQMNKSYDKQGFQGANPPFNLTAGAQSGNMSQASAYGTQYVLPHSQQAMSLHHTLQADVTQGSGPGVGGQRSMSQTHKSSAAGTGSYAKYNWS